MKRFFKILKRSLLVLLGLLIILAVVIFFYMRQPQFGQAPSGERQSLIEKSPHYKDGRFRNLVETPTIAEGYSIWGEMYKTVFKEIPRRDPTDSLPSVKTNLLSLSRDSNAVLWFGHSSCLVYIGGKTVLIDPVFSGTASPIPGSVKSYKGSDIYSAADMPQIDYLLISHDHYDHLDYETILALKSKVKHVVCGLGVGAHFERWGYDAKTIIEKDWYEKIALDSALTVYTESSHHESGRGFARGQSLWMSYLLVTPKMKIYLSGDGGFDNRFKDIGNRFGPIDLAIMECGQYDKAWHSVHNLPEEVMQATLDLKARSMIPVHHSKFTLAKHPWDEPLIRISALSQSQPYILITPMIGETVNLNNQKQVFSQWWKGIN